MTKFKHLALLLLAAITVFGCSSDYDDSGLKKDVSDLQSRVEKLEKWCETANGQITSLQGLVTALQNNDYVTGVTSVIEEGTEVGYTISFTKSSPITIMHGTNGTNGKDGVTPIIGVKQHSDGLYYWTLQTGSSAVEWLKDAGGKMIPTTGKDGVAGQKPVIGIAKDNNRYYWQLDGEWLKDATGNKVPTTGDKGDTGATGATGPQGAQGAKGDSFFKSVTPDTTKGTVVIKLANDTEFTLPMLSTTVSFEAYTPLQVSAAATATSVKVTLPATLKKEDFAAIKADITNVAGTNTAISRAPAEKWTVALTAPTFKNGKIDVQPTVTVTVPATAIAGETALLKVTVVDTKGNESSSTRALFYDNRVAVTGVTLVPTAAVVKVGKTERLTATVAPANATNKNVIWTSSDATIATVADGVVTGVKAGNATITVATEDGGFTISCDIEVQNIAVESITFTDATATISIGGKKTLSPTFTPTDATIKTVTWTSSNPDVATVSATGEVEGKAKGEVTITATSTEYTSIKGICKVTVEDTPKDYIEVNGIKVAVGNLVAKADGSGCKIGKATDGGLYFQFGSLIGWSTTGDPSIVVKPAGCTVTSWNSSWMSDPAIEDAVTGIGDPCKYYLKGTWRLPTTDEYEKLFENHGYPSTGPWKWENSSATNSTNGLTFPASGSRNYSAGSLRDVGTRGYSWCSFPNDRLGYLLSFTSSMLIPSGDNYRANGYPVRCVQTSN